MRLVVGCLLIAACPPSTVSSLRADSGFPTYSGAETALDPRRSARVRDVGDFLAAVQRSFEGRLDERGVIFVDAWEDEAEEARPKRATVLCDGALARHKRAWIDDLRTRVSSQQEFVCDGETCEHEAAEGMDYRGQYRFERGILRVVVHTSGASGYVTGAILSMDRRFVVAAVEALADAPCGTEFTAYPSYDPSRDGIE